MISNSDFTSAFITAFLAFSLAATNSLIFKCNPALGSSRIKQKRQNSILSNIIGNILLGVIRAHLLLIDVLLEDIAQHIGVDLISFLENTFIQMPAIIIEEIEQSPPDKVCANVGTLVDAIRRAMDAAVSRGQA